MANYNAYLRVEYNLDEVRDDEAVDRYSEVCYALSASGLLSAKELAGLDWVDYKPRTDDKKRYRWRRRIYT